MQGLVIRDGKVLKTETSYGTKKMLQSIKPNKVMSGILIKLPKKKQDLRIDLPTIGLDTLNDCKRAGLKGVVLKHKQNIYFILVAILTCVAIYYFKDLSIALGQTEKISLVLSVWMPIIVISLFCSIGIIHINEK